MTLEPISALNAIAQSIFDKKGFNILALDVRGISSLTDFVIIAEGNVDKHVRAIAHAIMESLKEHEIRPYFTQGLNNGDWIVLDFMDIMVHLFMPGLREKYMLEQLWKEGSIVDLQIDTEPKNLSII